MSSPIESKWKTVCDQVVSFNDVDEVQFNALMERVIPQVFSDGFLLITADTSFLKSWIEKNFLEHIKRALTELYGMPFSVVVEIDSAGSTNDSTTGSATGSATGSSTGSATGSTQGTFSSATQNSSPEASEKTTSPSLQSSPEQAVSAVSTNTISPVSPASSPAAPSSLGAETQDSASTLASSSSQNSQTTGVAAGSDNSDAATFKTLTFENFVRGDSNRMAYSMAVQVAETPGNALLNPLFIYGKSGLGKTHLMRAIQNYINSTQPLLNTVYEDTDNFVSGYVNATIDHTRGKNSYQDFIKKYEEADVLLIDDVQFLQNKEGTIDIIFQIFNKLINKGKQIVLSADRAPNSIGIDERYTSRFAQGGSIDIHPPEVETKLAIVKMYINEHQSTEGANKINVPEDIQLYIAENSGSNIRELKSAVTHLVMYMNYLDQPNITLIEAKELLENHFSRRGGRNLTVEDIQKEVESFYKIKHSDLVGPTRTKTVATPRQIAMYLCRQLLDDPLDAIGKKFNRDHSTVLYSVSKIESDVVTNRSIQEEIEAIKKRINDF